MVNKKSLEIDSSDEKIIFNVKGSIGKFVKSVCGNDLWVNNFKLNSAKQTNQIK